MKDNKVLTPVWERSSVGPPGQRMKDVIEILQYGEAVAAIERQAKASDAASRRRRVDAKRRRYVIRALHVGIPFLTAFTIAVIVLLLVSGI